MERMKTVLIELLAFVLICVLGTAIGGFVLMIFNSVTNFVVGRPLDLFSARGFIHGAIAVFPVIMLFVPLFLYLTLIRHPKYNKVSGAITIALLSLAAWIFATPVFFSAAKKQNVFYSENPDQLTSGYFRNFNNRMFYFTIVSGNYASGLRLDGEYFTASNPEKKVKILDSFYINYKRGPLGFCDPIIGDNMTPPTVLNGFLNGIAAIEQKAFESMETGKKEWLLFSTIMAALASIGAVISASEWRLADAFYITFDTFAILALNYLCIAGTFDSAAQAVSDLSPVLAFAKNNFQVIVNAAAVLLLSFLGIFKAIVHAASAKRGAQ